MKEKDSRNRDMNWLPDDDLLVNGNLDRNRVRFRDMDCLVDWVRIGFRDLDWVGDRVGFSYRDRLEDRDGMMLDDRDRDSYWLGNWNRYRFGNRDGFGDWNDLLDSLIDGNLDRNVNWMRN
jgi:hypothetical protein